MAEDEPSEADLSGRLATVLEEIRDVWKSASSALKSCAKKSPRLKMTMKI